MKETKREYAVSTPVTKGKHPVVSKTAIVRRPGHFYYVDSDGMIREMQPKGRKGS